jgi:uncharacterized protein YutE (UPF0331/DUF86 family)
MVLRPEAVRARLLKLEEIVSRLELLAEEASRGTRADQWTVERGLQLACEVALDIGNHILSAHFGVSAQDYEDILEQLAQRSVVPRALRERLKGMGGFRNILVHDYLRLDPDVVARKLTEAPGDFSEFALAVRTWLEARS